MTTFFVFGVPDWDILGDDQSAMVFWEILLRARKVLCLEKNALCYGKSGLDLLDKIGRNVLFRNIEASNELFNGFICTLIEKWIGHSPNLNVSRSSESCEHLRGTNFVKELWISMWSGVISLHIPWMMWHVMVTRTMSFMDSHDA